MPAWGVGKDGKALPTAAQRSSVALSANSLFDALPTSAPDFERQWRRCGATPDLRYAFLRRFEPSALQQVMKGGAVGRDL